MDTEKLRKEIEFFEGNVPKVYLDSLGLKTAGIGHLLTHADADMPVGTPVSPVQVNRWFNDDLRNAVNLANKIIPDLGTHDEVRQRLIVNLVFNLGNKFSTFKNTINCFNNRDYNGAAENLHMSKWFTQVGRRGPAIVLALRTGLPLICK